MNFEEWHNKNYHPALGKEHRYWEEKAWNAAIEEAARVARDNECDVDGYHYCGHNDVIACRIKRLGE